jgi:hypothetical protein
MEEPVGEEPSLFAFVLPRAAWGSQRARFAALGTIRDKVPMRMREISVGELLADGRDRAIQFATSRADGP